MGAEEEHICSKMYQQMIKSSSRWGGDTAAAPGDTEGDRPELGCEEPWLGWDMAQTVAQAIEINLCVCSF